MVAIPSERIDKTLPARNTIAPSTMKPVNNGRDRNVGEVRKRKREIEMRREKTEKLYLLGNLYFSLNATNQEPEQKPSENIEYGKILVAFSGL